MLESLHLQYYLLLYFAPMMSRQAHFSLRTIVLMVAMYLIAWGITRVLGEWEFWFVGIWLAGLCLVVLSMEVVEKSYRRDHPAGSVDDLQPVEEGIGDMTVAVEKQHEPKHRSAETANA
jgi:hypothetical protein